MEQEVAQSTTIDAFDAAVTAASTYVEPISGEDSADKVSVARDAKGRFAANEASASELDEIPTPDGLTAEDLAEKRRDHGQDVSDRAAEKKAEAVSKKPRHDAQARIDQITREREEARREAARLKAELESVRAPRPTAKPATAEAAPDPNDATKYPGGEYDPKYLKDQARYEARQEFQEQQAKAAKEFEDSQKEREFNTKAAAFVKRLNDAGGIEKAGVDPRVLSGKPLSLLTSKEKADIARLPQKQREEIGFLCFLADQWDGSEHDLELVQYLSVPENFQRLATLHPNKVIRELARVEAGFGAASTKDRGPAPKPSASQANPPIKPLGTTPHAPADDDGSEDESVEKFISRENAKERKAGRL